MSLSRSAEKRRAARKIERGQRALEAYRAQEVVKARMERMRVASAQTVTLTTGPVVTNYPVNLAVNRRVP